MVLLVLCVATIWVNFDTSEPEKRVVLVRRTGGTVKWFDDAMGFGFIAQEGGKDVFVHYTAIVSEGFRSLAEGDSVEFDMVEGPKGLYAAKVIQVDHKH